MEDSDHQSGALIIGSNDDLLIEILIRLPVTSILRFKSVSKHWRLLLSHKHFTYLYDNHTNVSKSVGLFGKYDFYVPFDVENRSPPPFRSLDFYFNRVNVRIRQSCNGLLLCCTCHNGVSDYYVFNPTTKQLAFITPLGKYSTSMALAYDQTHSPHYKVVCVCASESQEDMFQIQIYSSETSKWKICIESFAARESDFYRPVYWNGSVHWAPDRLDNSFLYLKLDVEELQMLPAPEKLVSANLSTGYFGESRGHLHLIPSTDFRRRRLIPNVYEMLRDRSGWFLKYRLQLNELPDFPEMLGYPGFVDVIRGKEEEETFLVLKTHETVMKYNIHDKSYNEIYSLADDDFYYGETSRYNFLVETASCHRYIEALSSF